MTDLTKTVKRRTRTTSHDGRALIIEIHPNDIIVIREAGRRKGYSIPVIAAYRLGARMEAEARMKERKAKKKGKKI